MFSKEWAFLLIEYQSPPVGSSENREGGSEEDVHNHAHKENQGATKSICGDTSDLGYAFESYFDDQSDHSGVGKDQMDEEHLPPMASEPEESLGLTSEAEEIVQGIEEHMSFEISV